MSPVFLLLMFSQTSLRYVFISSSRSLVIFIIAILESSSFALAVLYCSGPVAVGLLDSGDDKLSCY